MAPIDLDPRAPALDIAVCDGRKSFAAPDADERQRDERVPVRRLAIVDADAGCVEVGAQVLGAVGGLEASGVSARVVFGFGDVALGGREPGLGIRGRSWGRG
ncbi:MAG: hypothetical protein IPK00_13600 [Deltaproteobacteria bacterium]|nr:hypothetical protein [Deltaproteobacteria bacterium]